MTVAISMGQAESGQDVGLDLEELLATRLLVQGNSGSGKSHLLRRLLEQSADWVQQVVIDPEGDFTSLAGPHGHLVIDAAEHAEPALQRAAERVRLHRVSVVLNLEGLDAEAQMRRAGVFLNGLFDVGREAWSPLLVVVDEAQIFAPAVAGDVAEDARKTSLGAMTNLMCRGRKRGLAGVIATQRLAKLAKNVAAEASNFLMGRTFLDIDMARAADLLGMERRQAEMFRDLRRGHFVALGPALSRRPLPLRIGATTTESRGAGPGLTPLPRTAPETARDLVLAAMPAEPPRVRRVPPPPAPDILAQLAQARPVSLREPDGAEVPPTIEALEERRSQQAAILREMMNEAEAPFRPVAVLYQDFLVRRRIHRVGGAAPDLPAFQGLLASARAGLDASVTGHPDWDRAAALASALPDEARGAFLLLARAALDGAPCPSDAAIARAYGSHSAGRARRLLSYMEEQGVIVCQPDAGGGRRVVLPELGWHTGPGDPHADAA